MRDTFATCSEIQSFLLAEHGIRVSLATVHRRRRQCNLTFKRAARSHQHELPSADHPFMHDADPFANAICLDESCFVSSDTPRYGWAPPGRAVPKPAPRKRATVSTLLALDRTGFVARETRKGAFDSVSYAAFVATLPRGRIIISDNVQFHKSWRVRYVAHVRSQTLLHTPPYCPWMNPVEHGFSVAKHCFRRRRYERPSEPFLAAVDASFECITPDKCDGFFRGAEQRRQEAIAQLRASGALDGVAPPRGGTSLFFMEV